MLCPNIGILQGSTYLLDTDALDSEVSGVLDQVQNGCERVICYGSKKLSKTQRNYCVTRRELLAAITCIAESRHYILQFFQFENRSWLLEAFLDSKNLRANLPDGSWTCHNIN